MIDSQLSRRALLRWMTFSSVSLALAACVQPQAGAPAASDSAASGGDAAPAAAPSADIRKSTSSYQGTLNYWVLGASADNAFATPMGKACSKFMELNPDIKVEIIGYPPNQEGFTKLTTAVQSGEGVDILRLPSDVLASMVKDDLIAPIDDFLSDSDKSDIYPNLLDLVRLKDGKAFAWPLWVVPMGMYLNKDVFAEKGLELPAADWTWEQFVDLTKQLTFKRDNGEQVYGFNGFIDPGVINTWGLFLNEGPNVRPFSADVKKFTLDTPEAATALTRYASLALEHKVTPPDFGAMKDADVKAGFTNKQYAIIIDATGPAAQFKKDGVNFEIREVPTYNGNHATSGAVGLVAVPAMDDAVKLRAAMDLARYLTSAEVMEDVPPSDEAPTGFYLAPAARASVKVATPLDTFVPFIQHMWSPPIMAEWVQIRQLIHPELQNIVFGKATPEEAMARIAPEINKILEAAGM